MDYAGNEQAPDVAPSEAEPKSVVAIDNPHIAHKADAGKPVAKFRSLFGEVWTYRNKRAWVLQMLVNAPNGVTQHDTLPWHTRLGGTIHAMRKDGLAITTEIEGEFRHARYRLATAGCLIKQAENREGEQ